MLSLVDGAGRVVQTHEIELGASAWPPHGTSVWPVGSVLSERYFFRLPKDAPASLELRVRGVGAAASAEFVALRYEVHGDVVDLRTRFDR